MVYGNAGAILGPQWYSSSSGKLLAKTKTQAWLELACGALGAWKRYQSPKISSRSWQLVHLQQDPDLNTRGFLHIGVPVRAVLHQQIKEPGVVKTGAVC